MWTCLEDSWVLVQQDCRNSELRPSSWGWEQLGPLKMAAGTLLQFFLASSLGIFIPVTLPLVFSWGFLILMQGLPHYTSSGSLWWGQEEKPVI